MSNQPERINSKPENLDSRPGTSNSKPEKQPPSVPQADVDSDSSDGGVYFYSNEFDRHARTAGDTSSDSDNEFADTSEYRECEHGSDEQHHDGAQDSDDSLDDGVYFYSDEIDEHARSAGETTSDSDSDVEENSPGRDRQDSEEQQRNDALVESDEDIVYFYSDELDTHARTGETSESDSDWENNAVQSSESGSSFEQNNDAPVEQKRKKRKKNRQEVMHCPLCVRTYTEIYADKEYNWLLRTRCGHTACFKCVCSILEHDDGRERCHVCRHEGALDVFDMKPIEIERRAHLQPGFSEMNKNRKKMLRKKEQIPSCCMCTDSYRKVKHLRRGRMLSSDMCHHLVCSFCLEKTERAGTDRCYACNQVGAFAAHLLQEVFL